MIEETKHYVIESLFCLAIIPVWVQQQIIEGIGKECYVNLSAGKTCAQVSNKRTIGG